MLASRRGRTGRRSSTPTRPASAGRVQVLRRRAGSSRWCRATRRPVPPQRPRRGGRRGGGRERRLELVAAWRREGYQGVLPSSLDLRREDVLSLRRAHAGGLPLLPRVRRAGPVAAVAGERRKVVTVVFADVVGSTALGERVDAETLRWAMQRWFARMGDRRAPRRHGRELHRRRGDGRLRHPGRARGRRAARGPRGADMRDEVAALHEELRSGARRRARVRIGRQHRRGGHRASRRRRLFTTGDAVNVAARLEQAARPGEILLGARHATGSSPRRRGRGGRAADGQGQERAGRGVPPARRRPRRAGRPRAHRHPDGRPRPGACASDRRVRARGRRSAPASC